MKINRILSALSAAAIALSMAAMTVSADEAAEKQEFNVTADAEKLSSENHPALSFDSEAFKEYLHLTRDADKAGIKITHDRDTYYQGASVRISANSGGVDGFTGISGMARDKDNNLLFEDAPEAEELDKMSIMGVELHAEDYSLTCFNGCTIYFAYRLTEEDSTALQGGSVWVYPAAENSERMDTPLQLKVNTAAEDNVSQYRKQVMTVPFMTKDACTKLIFEVPCTNQYKGNCLYLDNIIIELPDDFGNNRFVKNVDNYNATAEPREIIEELKIKKSNNSSAADTKVEKSKDKTSPIIVVIIVVIAVGVVGGIIFAIKKLKNRFY